MRICSVYTVDFRILHTGLQGHDGRRFVRLSGLEHKYGMADDGVFDHVHTRVFPIQSVQNARNVYAGRCTRRSHIIIVLINGYKQIDGYIYILYGPCLQTPDTRVSGRYVNAL